jgi:hypothetical protein
METPRALYKITVADKEAMALTADLVSKEGKYLNLSCFATKA